MFKKGPLLKGWDLEPGKNSENYLEMKAMLVEFEKDYQLQQKRSSKFYSIFSIKLSIPHIHYKFNFGSFCPF